MSRALTLLVLILLAVSTVTAQKTVSKKKSELKNLRSSIKSTQQKIDRLARKEKNTKKSIGQYEKRQHATAVFIKQLEDDLTKLRDSASVLEGQISNTKAALQDAEASYNAATKALLRYKLQRKGVPETAVTTDALFTVMSKSVSKYRSRMIRIRDSLNAEEDLLNDYSMTQDSVLSVKTTEELVLKSTIAKRSNELTKIRRDKKSLARQLAKKQQSVKKLRKLINKLVADARRKAEEKARREAAKRKKSKKKTSPPTKTTVKGFARKSLPWPTSSKKILHKYGSYKNPQTGTVLDNPGIDIKAKLGSAVKSVSKGEVTSVTFLPGYNTIVIVDHGNGVRSVYGNLAKVNVREGTKVNRGTKLGSSGENIDGLLVHFEIWNGRSRQNPIKYLR